MTSAGKSIRLSNTIFVHFKNYATNHLLSEITTAGYFNNCRNDLSLNTVIHTVADCDGTPNYVTLRVTGGLAVGSDITTAIDTPAS
jgi:hypothetical protein